jgi:hypothetical protein
MDRLLHDIDARLDGLVVSEQHLGVLERQRSMRKSVPKLQRAQLNIVTELTDPLKRRLHAWEANALTLDTASLRRWHKFVVDQNKTAAVPVSLYDPMHKSFFKELIHQQKVNGNRWRRAHRYRQRIHEDKFWPMGQFIDSESESKGFSVFDMNVKHPSYPTILDQDGTFSELYCSLLPAMQLSALLNTHRSSGIHHTVLCKGAGEFYEARPGVFAPPKIPRTKKDERDYDNVGGDAEESEEDVQDPEEYSGQPRSAAYWEDDSNGERKVRPARAPAPMDGPPPADDAATAMDEPPAEDAATANTPYDDPETVPSPLDKTVITDLPTAVDIRALEGEEKFEIQGDYITALNMKAYFRAALRSLPVYNAVARKKSPHTTDRVNRVSIWVYLKAHMLMITWDTLIDAQGPFLHQIYLSSSYPEPIYYYPGDYRDGKIYKDVLATFVECLSEMPAWYVNGLPVRVFEEIAIRSKLRRLFLRTDVEGFDLNCTAFMMLAAIYQALVLNVVTQPDERGNVAPGDELTIATETPDIARFATLNTKKFFRSLLYRFDTDFRKLLHTNINEGKVLCFDPKIGPPVISIDAVRLSIFDHYHAQTHIGFNHRVGFVQHRDPATLRSGKRPRMQR